MLRLSLRRGGRSARRQRGQGLVEYALILVLVAVVVIGAASLMGGQIKSAFCTIVVDLGGNLPANVAAACFAPQITLTGISDGATTTSPLTVEAILTDPKTHLTITNAQTVTFYIDGSQVQVEYVYKYCLGSGDASCNPLAVSSGPHTLRVVAVDSKGQTAETSISFTISG